MRKTKFRCLVIPKLKNIFPNNFEIALDALYTNVSVIFAIPSYIDVTTPLLSTVATSGLLLLQIIFLFVAFSGYTVALNVVVKFELFKRIVSSVLFNVTLATFTVVSIF
mgnify:CR=1 FL=1